MFSKLRTGAALVDAVARGTAGMFTRNPARSSKADLARTKALAERVPMRTGRVSTDGDDLYYEVRGSGPPLLMISGGGGDAGFYTYPAALLADEFQVITYDRRGNSRSTGRNAGRFDMHQQAADAVAVLGAAGHRSALVFGNSGGAIVALEMARAFPDSVTAAVAHEPPVLTVLPDRERWLGVFRAITGPISRMGGATTAMFVFALTTGIPFSAYAFHPADFAARSGANQPFFVRTEMYPFVSYEPDIAALAAGGIPIAFAVGAVTLAADRYYGRPAAILADRLGTRPVTMPGHHTSYFDRAEPWTAALRAVLPERPGRTAD
ncbi:alpha/beta hydrolase [Dactylosporangium sp. NPDC000244]|uniref:alpha/beta fold hydrolase n=1 Tax=Dactylosporangium sp. NPDC000244 TaxID=3154365 RepID=UPI00332DAB4E